MAAHADDTEMALTFGIGIVSVIVPQSLSNHTFFPPPLLSGPCVSLLRRARMDVQ
jgi:hypothetical protein